MPAPRRCISGADPGAAASDGHGSDPGFRNQQSPVHHLERITEAAAVQGGRAPVEISLQTPLQPLSLAFFYCFALFPPPGA